MVDRSCELVPSSMASANSLKEGGINPIIPRNTYKKLQHSMSMGISCSHPGIMVFISTSFGGKGGNCTRMGTGRPCSSVLACCSISFFTSSSLSMSSSSGRSSDCFRITSSPLAARMTLAAAARSASFCCFRISLSFSFFSFSLRRWSSLSSFSRIFSIAFFLLCSSLSSLACSFSLSFWSLIMSFSLISISFCLTFSSLNLSLSLSLSIFSRNFSCIFSFFSFSLSRLT
mmetsp:Transcript_10069/g.61199  ORF Transcript_10069/g.61199 Transcript_10069/m.61199 type:complete len:230 (+) Transcript_10069:4036-4725(+)